MIDSPTSANLGDFKQRYAGVIGRLIDHPDKPLVKVGAVGSTKVTFVDMEGTTYYANVDKGIQFEFLPALRGWYNTPEGPVLLNRVPARQWKRGMCPDNHSVARSYGGMVLTTMPEDWYTVVFRVFSTNQDYINSSQVWDGKTDIALSRHFCISADKVFFYNLTIGFWSAATKSIVLTQDYIRQELKDMIKKHNLQIEVV